MIWAAVSSQSYFSYCISSCRSFSIFGCKEYNQSDFDIDHLMMSTYRVISCVAGRGYETVWKIKKDMTLKDEFPRLVGAHMLLRNNSRKNEEVEPKQNQSPSVVVTNDWSKVQWCKEQYCIGTWNIRSMNQGKLEVVKQEMARVNTDILGISELKWTGMGELNLDDHYIYYCGQESLRRNLVAFIVNKRI